MAEHGEIAAVGGRNVQAALIHRREQADGLQRHGFAAGVRPRDNERIKAVPKLKAYRDGLCLIQQRMPRAVQDDALVLKRGRAAVELIG